VKGISSVVTTVLVLAIAVSLAGIYSEWAPRITENITKTATEGNENNIRCGNAALSIDDPVYDKTGEITLFDLRNAGTIRFSDQIRVAAINSSRIINRTNVTGIGVDETVSERIDTSRYPDRIIAYSDECPELQEEETVISVRK